LNLDFAQDGVVWQSLTTGCGLPILSGGNFSQPSNDFSGPSLIGSALIGSDCDMTPNIHGEIKSIRDLRIDANQTFRDDWCAGRV
jgi:hypothetical protein